MERGILYIAVGEEYVKMAKRSAKRIKDSDSDVPIALITDLNGHEAPTCFDKHIEHPEPDRKSKPAAMYRSPWKNTIYFDTDTYIVDPINEVINDLFNILNGVDIAAMQPAKTYIRPGENYHPNPIPPDSYQQYNTGVLVFNSDCKNLMKAWRDRHRKYEKGDDLFHDQASFRDVAFQSECKFGTLPSEFNYHAGGGGYQYLSEPVKIIHGKMNKTTFGKVERNINNPKQMKQRARAYEIINFGEVASIYHLNPRWKRWIRTVITSLRSRGILKTYEHMRENLNLKLNK